MYTIDRLLKGGGPQREQHSTIDHPLEHLVACHDRIEERLKVLERCVDSLETRPAEARAALESVFRYFESSGITHTADEEESVFPRMQDRLTEQEAALVADLERQHREADELYARLKSGPIDRETVDRFCALYRAHIATENRDLIAAARRVLAPAELDDISAEMKRRRGFG